MSKAAELANLIGNINAGGGTGQNKNAIINGAMNVAQRKTSTTGLKNSGAIYTIDRFSYRRGGTWTNFDSKHEQVTITDSLPVSKGLHNALRVTCTTAEGSVPSGTEATGIGYFLELRDLHRFGVGTANMKTMTLSFYVKASIATTYGFTIIAGVHATPQAVDIPFTVSSANTYERISITLPTYNVAFNTTFGNGLGWQLFWVLDGVASSRTASAWGDKGDDGMVLPNGVSATGFSNTLNATFELTGVQLEVGQNPTELEHKPFAEELALCKRYYCKSYDYGSLPGTANLSGAIYNRFNASVSNRTDLGTRFPVNMRTIPDVTPYDLQGTVDKVSDCGTGVSHGSSISVSTVQNIGQNGFGGFTCGTTFDQLGGYHYEADAEL